MRVMLGGLLAGVGGAALIAVLVLGRGESVGALTWETLNEEGGVLWMHIESYERPSFEGAFRPFHEQTISDTWSRAEPRTNTVVIFASHTLEGVMLVRSRITGGTATPQRWPGGEPRDWPRPQGPDIGKSDGRCDAFGSQGLEPVVGLREGETICIEPYPRPLAGTSSGAAEPAWPIDLDVVSAQKEVRLNAQGGLESIVFRALLEDGSRAVFASQRVHLSVLPLSEWEGIEELVWGD